MKKLPLILLFVGFIFLVLSTDINFTGAVIGRSIKITNIFFFIFSLTFFIFSVILFIGEKSLESSLVNRK